MVWLQGLLVKYVYQIFIRYYVNNSTLLCQLKFKCCIVEAEFCRIVFWRWSRLCNCKLNLPHCSEWLFFVRCVQIGLFTLLTVLWENLRKYLCACVNAQVVCYRWCIVLWRVLLMVLAFRPRLLPAVCVQLYLCIYSVVDFCRPTDNI